MRDCSSDLETDIALEATTLCRLWKVIRADGTILRFTDTTEDVVIGGDGTYRSDISFTCSAIFTSAALQNAQDLTMTFGLADDAVSERDLRQHLYDAAECFVMLANFEHPDHGVMILFRGTFGDIKLSDKQAAQVTIAPLSAALVGRQIGAEVYSQTCRASLGDARCGFDLDAAKVAFTVDSVTGTSVTSSALSDADNSYAQGYVVWQTGDNAGTTSLILSSLMSSTRITLAASPAQAIQVGDTGLAYPGCDKVLSTCKNKFNRLAFMRAEPFVPGQDVLPPLPVATTGTGI